MITYHMTESQAELIHNMARDRMAAYKNWIASAVESGDLARAQTLVGELRDHEAIFASFNRQSRRDIAAWTGKPLETETTVRASERRPVTVQLD